jgi:hypothetical protein
VRGWWPYFRLVGWRLAVLAVAAGSSAARAPVSLAAPARNGRRSP